MLLVKVNCCGLLRVGHLTHHALEAFFGFLNFEINASFVFPLFTSLALGPDFFVLFVVVMMFGIVLATPG